MSSHSLDTLKELIEVFVQIVNKYNKLDRKALNYGSGDLLFPSEIHMINAVEKYRGSNITEIADRMGITKSAASQVVIKLENKKLVEKIKSGQNEKSVFLKVTKKGKAALNGFETFKNDIFNDIINELNLLDTSQVDFIQYVFKRINEHMDYKLSEKK